MVVLTGFQTILLGAKNQIHTNHLNITTNNITLVCVIHWLNYVEQYNPYIHFIPGKDNVIAETIAWLNGHDESVLTTGDQIFVLDNSISKGTNFPDGYLVVELFLHLPLLPVHLVGSVFLCPVGLNTDRTDIFRHVMDRSVTCLESVKLQVKK